MKFVKRKAFSLLEISIVIMIIGILIAGIAQAIEMFSEASLKSARNLSKLSRVSRIEDLTLWLDATASEAFDKEKDDTSKVSIWKDTNAGASSIISSSSSSASLYPSYASSAINKLPAVSFKKTSSLVGNCVTVPNGSFINSSEDFTLYLIYNPKTLDDGIIIEKNNASATTFPFSLELLSGSYKFSVKNSTNTISVISPKQPRINTPNLIRLSRIKDSQIEIAIDGISTTQADTPNTAEIEVIIDGVNTTQTIIIPSSALNNAELAIGCRNGATPANFINGDIGETAFYNRNLNPKDKSDIEEYLYKKWKMKKFEGTLPATITPLPVNTCLVSAGTGYSAKSQLSIGSGTFSCDVAGYSGTINYTCPSSGGTATISGSCTSNTCTVSAGTGYTARSLSLIGSDSFSCDVAGYNGTINYTCPSSGGTATITGSCTANTCSVTAGTGYIAKPQLFGSGSFPCDVAGYTGTINYSCTTDGATVAGNGSCTPITCSVSAGTGYTAKPQLSFGSGSFPCDTGYSGTINYNCPSSGGTINGTGTCTESPIKCYAKDMLGFRGTNYLDTIYNVYDPSTYMIVNNSQFYIDNAQQSILPLVNRLKLYDVYHGSVNHSSRDGIRSYFDPIDMSKFPQTAYQSSIVLYHTNANNSEYGIYGEHTFTKYARVLGYGNNTFNCDSGFTGTLTYDCETDASTLNPISGSCTAN